MGSSKSSNLQYPSDLQCFSTMRTAAFFIPLLVCAHGAADAETTGTCLLDSSEAVSDALDAAMFMWAAVDRCGKTAEEIKCSVGIMSSVQSVNGMINVILKAMHKCGDFNNVDAQCTMAGLELTKASAGSGASAANVAQHCENGNLATNTGTGTAIANGNWPQQDPAQCIVDIKDSLKNLFKAVRSLMAVTNKCQMGSEHCASDVMSIMAALSGFGGYLSGAVGHCSPPATVTGSVCGQASLQLNPGEEDPIQGRPCLFHQPHLGCVHPSHSHCQLCGRSPLQEPGGRPGSRVLLGQRVSTRLRL